MALTLIVIVFWFHRVFLSMEMSLVKNCSTTVVVECRCTQKFTIGMIPWWIQESAQVEGGFSDSPSFRGFYPQYFFPSLQRSCFANDASFLANPEEGGAGSGFGWTHCMYFSRGFCKNGSYCKFLHSANGDAKGIDVGSPGRNFSGLDEFLRMKAIQQQRFALMASGGHSSYGCSKRANFLNVNQRLATAALMMGDHFQKTNRYLPERNDSFSMELSSIANLSSRQIYLTFPADSTFKEGDVSVYFRNFGPVQDVSIPYQQKRMFGFVTFAFPETVKLILAKETLILFAILVFLSNLTKRRERSLTRNIITLS